MEFCKQSEGKFMWIPPTEMPFAHQIRRITKRLPSNGAPCNDITHAQWVPHLTWAAQR